MTSENEAQFSRKQLREAYLEGFLEGLNAGSPNEYPTTLELWDLPEHEDLVEFTAEFFHRDGEMEKRKIATSPEVVPLDRVGEVLTMGMAYGFKAKHLQVSSIGGIAAAAQWVFGNQLLSATKYQAELEHSDYYDRPTIFLLVYPENKIIVINGVRK